MNKLSIGKINIFQNSYKARIFYLIILCLSSFCIRFYFYPEDLPPLGDAVGYFWYANDMSMLGNFPHGYTLDSGAVKDVTNDGWPAFLSIFFSLIDSNNFLDYVNVQRLLTIVISTLTVIPAYLLSKKFMETPYALLCATAFAFAPRLIENSLMGLTEPLFLLLCIVSLNLFLSDKKYLIIIAFATAALFSIIRYEGLLILIPFTIIFFFRFRKNKSLFLKYGLAIGVFFLIIFPMAMVRIENTGEDGFTSHLIHGPQYYADTTSNSGSYDVAYEFLEKGSFFLIQYMLYVSIPIFFIFIPYGMLEIFRKKDYKKWTMIIFGLVFLIPAFYAYSRGFQDIRYLFILYPIFCLAIGYTIRRIDLKIKKPNAIFFGTVILVISLSITFTNYSIPDFEGERETYTITKQIFQLTDKVNRDYEDIMYMKWSNDLVLNEFPILQTEIKEKLGKSKAVIIGKGTSNDFDNLQNYLAFGKSEGMTHLILDGRNMNTEFLNKIFIDETEYPYLIKIYDSHDNGFKKQVKVFKIDYKLMNEFYE